MKKVILVFAFVFASSIAFANTSDVKSEKLESSSVTEVTIDSNDDVCQFTMTSVYNGWSITRTIYCNGEPTIQSQIDQLHRDVKALSDRMGRPGGAVQFES